MRWWLPPGHLAWQVIEVTGELDLSRFAAAYRADGQGQAPYDPAMMTGLLLYCYFKGIRSSRKTAAACIDDVGCLVICGGARPSHRAVTEFIRRHRPEIRRLFVQVLSLLAAEGAVAGQLAAVDGSPVIHRFRDACAGGGRRRADGGSGRRRADGAGRTAGADGGSGRRERTAQGGRRERTAGADGAGRTARGAAGMGWGWGDNTNNGVIQRGRG